MANTKKTIFAKKAFKIFAFLIAFILIIVAAFFIFLRTSTADKFIFKQISNILAKSGYSLSVDKFEGPLPGRLIISGLTFADAQGPLIKAEKLEIQLAPLALLKRTVHVPLAKIEKPQIIRLPKSGESKDDSPSGDFSLPVKIQVDKFEIIEGALNENALAANGINNNKLFFKTEAKAKVLNRSAEAFLSTELFENNGNKLLALNLNLKQKANKDNLDLDLKIDDQAEGFLSVLLNDPAWPGMKLALEGHGPLDSWRGELSFFQKGLAEILAELDIKTAQGNIWKDIIKDKNLSAALKAELKAQESFPAPILKLLGEQADLKANINLLANEAKLNINMKAISGLGFNSDINGQLKPGGGQFSLNALLSGLKNPNDDISEQAALSFNILLSDKVQKIDNFKLSGQDLLLEAFVDRQLEADLLQAKIKFNSNLASPLIASLIEAADVGYYDLAGILKFETDIDVDFIQKTAEGNLKLSGDELKWPSAELENLIGPKVDVLANLTGGGDKALELKITHAKSSLINLNANASLNLEENIKESDYTLNAQVSLNGLEKLAPDFEGDLDLSLSSSGRPTLSQTLIKVYGSSISTPQGKIKNSHLNLDMSGNIVPLNTTDDNMMFKGALNFTAEDSPGGPLYLKSAWDLKRSGQNIDLNVSELNGDLAGLKIAGDLKAFLGKTQKLDGEISLAVEAWKKLAALSGQKISGSPAHAFLKLSSKGKGQAFELKADLDDFKYGSGKETLLSLKKAKINLQANEIFNQADIDLNFSLGAGISGPFSWQSADVSAKGLEGKGDINVDLRQARLKGSGGSRADGLQFSAKYDISDEFMLNISKLDFALAGGGFKLKDQAQVRLGEHLNISPFTLNFQPKGQLSAKVDLKPGAMAVSAKGGQISLKAFKAFNPASMIDGEIQSLNVDLRQHNNNLSGNFELQTLLSSKELKNIKPLINLKGELLSGPAPSLNIDGKIDGGASWKSEGLIKARLPLTNNANGFPEPNMRGPLSADIKFTGPIGPLWALLGQPDRYFNGLLRLEAVVGGTLAKPLPNGKLYLAGGKYEDAVLGLLVNDIKLEAHSTPDLPLKALLSAKDGKSGGLALEAQIRNLAAPVISAKGRLKQFSPTHRDDMVFYISGDFGAEGPLDRLAISSDLTLDQGELDLQFIMAAGSIPTLPISNIGDAINRTSRGMRSNLKLNIPGRFFIRGPGLESEWRGTLGISGSTNKPNLTGQIAPIRGYYTFAAKEFEFSGGNIFFSGGTNPILNLELTNRAPGLTAMLRFGGSATKPSLTMESQPALPEEEVLSHVLFGKDTSEISHFQALQLASAINDLRNFGNNGLSAISTLRSTIGLDVLRIGGSSNNQERQLSGMSGSMAGDLGGSGSNSPSGDQSDDISVEAGKYISDNIYMGVEHSGVGGAAVRLEVELAPSVSLEARSSTESSRVSLGWKKDY